MTLTLVWISLLLFLCGLLSIFCGIFAGNFWGRILLLSLGGLFFCLFGLSMVTFVQSGKANGVLMAFKRSWRRKKEELFWEEDTKNFAAREEEELTADPRREDETFPGEDGLQRTLEESRQRWQQEEANREREAKRIRLDTIREELRELYAKREALYSYETQVQAIDLAAKRIRELSDHIYREAGTQFSSRASQIIFKLTGGRYTQVTLDEQMEVRINTPAHLLTLSQVSFGTMNQIYFALRIAAGELLSYGEPLPLILDEAFAMYDDERLKAALRWLDESGRQVILFTCQRREKALLDQIRAER